LLRQVKATATTQNYVDRPFSQKSVIPVMPSQKPAGNMNDVPEWNRDGLNRGHKRKGKTWIGLIGGSTL
jgi:hypothetical protein